MRQTYEDTAAIGAEGKRLVMEYFREQKYIIQDYTGREEYASKFIDFSISDGTLTRDVLVRTDTKMCMTGNIVLETLMHRRDSSKLVPGWFYTCRSEILAYLDAYCGHLLMIDWGLLKQLANRGKIGYRRNFWNKIDHNTTGQLHIISCKDLKECPALKAVFHINVDSLFEYNWEKPNPF